MSRRSARIAQLKGENMNEDIEQFLNFIRQANCENVSLEVMEDADDLDTVSAYDEEDDDESSDYEEEEEYVDEDAQTQQETPTGEVDAEDDDERVFHHSQRRIYSTRARNEKETPTPRDNDPDYNPRDEFAPSCEEDLQEYFSIVYSGKNTRQTHRQQPTHRYPTRSRVRFA